MAVKKMEQSVEDLVARHGTRSPFELCDRLSVTVRVAELHSVRGFFYQSSAVRAVILNEALCDDERAFVCAHELGHVVLHPTLNTLFLREKTYCVSGRYEKEADLFAGILLLPRERRRELSREGYTIEQISSLCGVPTGVVERLFWGDALSHSRRAE